MYDSITFYLEESDFHINDEKFFDGKKTSQINGRFDAGSYFVNGVREQVRKNKRYYPSITLTKRTIGSHKTVKQKIRRLEIQVSLQKVCYETSKYEISPDNFPFFLKKIQAYLKMIGVDTDLEGLKRGVVSSMAFSKSITLPPYYGTAEQNIRRLAQFNHKSRSEFRHRDYLEDGGGISLKFHNDVRGFGIYCKYSEILNTGYTLIEEEIKRQVLEGKQSKDIIRFELTLQKKQTLEAVLRRFISTKKKDFTLNDIFTNTGISQKLLLKEFDEVFSPINTALICLTEMKDNQLDYLLRTKITDLNDRILASHLLNIAIKFGENQLWKQLRQETSSSTYNRTKRKFEKIIKELGEMKEPTSNLVEFLRSELVKFEPIKPVAKSANCQLPLKGI